MPLTLGEFFISLGMKGQKDVASALTNVQSGLQKTADMSWQAKAGIFAAIVGLEEISRQAVGTAIDLRELYGVTGILPDQFQKLGYIAERNNVPLSELGATIKGLESIQAKMLSGESVPRGALMLGVDMNKDIYQQYLDVGKKIRELSHDPQQIGIVREWAASLGFSDKMFSMWRIGDLSMAGYRKEMQLTTAEQNKLMALNREWSTFWMTVRGLSQKTVANDLAKPITEFVHLMADDVSELNHIATDLTKAFKKIDSPELETTLKAIGAALLIALAPIAPYTAGLVALAAILEKIHQMRNEKWDDKSLEKEAGDYKKKHGGLYRFFFGDSMAQTVLDMRKFEKEEAAQAAIDATRVPSPSPNVNVTNNITVDGARHPEETGRSVQRHINRGVQRHAPALGNR